MVGDGLLSPMVQESAIIDTECAKGSGDEGKGTWVGKGAGEERGKQNLKQNRQNTVTGGEDKQRLIRRRTNDTGRDGKREGHWRLLR